MDGYRHLPQNDTAQDGRMRRALSRLGSRWGGCRTLVVSQDDWNNRMGDVTTGAVPTDPAPFFDVHIFVCCNRRADGHPRGSCAARGSEALRDYMKARVKEARIPNARVNMAGCLDRCEDGPCIVIYPAGVWYRIESRDDVDLVIEQHLVGGRRAEGLRLPASRSG